MSCNIGHMLILCFDVIPVLTSANMVSDVSTSKKRWTVFCSFLALTDLSLCLSSSLS